MFLESAQLRVPGIVRFPYIRICFRSPAFPKMGRVRPPELHTTLWNLTECPPPPIRDWDWSTQTDISGKLWFKPQEPHLPRSWIKWVTRPLHINLYDCLLTTHTQCITHGQLYSLSWQVCLLWFKLPWTKTERLHLVNIVTVQLIKYFDESINIVNARYRPIFTENRLKVEFRAVNYLGPLTTCATATVFFM